MIFPFNLTEPPSTRPPERTRLERAVHRQKAVLANPKYLTLVAEVQPGDGDEEKKEVVGWAGYLRPEGCKDPHPWIVDDDEFEKGTEEDRKAWEGVERKYFNGQYTSKSSVICFALARASVLTNVVGIAMVLTSRLVERLG